MLDSSAPLSAVTRFATFLKGPMPWKTPQTATCAGFPITPPGHGSLQAGFLAWAPAVPSPLCLSKWCSSSDPAYTHFPWKGISFLFCGYPRHLPGILWALLGTFWTSPFLLCNANCFQKEAWMEHSCWNVSSIEAALFVFFHCCVLFS